MIREEEAYSTNSMGLEPKMVNINNNADQSLDPKESNIVSPNIDSSPAASASRKRKMAMTLDWLRTVAKSPDEPRNFKPHSSGYISRINQIRHQRSTNIDCRPLTNWKTLTKMFEWLRRVAISPCEPGVVGKDFGKNFATAVQVRHRMFSEDEKHGLPRVEITECDVWDEKNAALLRTRIFGPEVRSCGQADIPEWIGKPSLSDEDPNASWFLGETIWTPEISADVNCGSIGKGRQDDYMGPGSITFVRTRVAEKRSELKRELGPAFYKMGLDQMGEEVARTWTRDEETRFYTIAEQNCSSSKLLEKLLAAFAHSKSREDILSYYYNVYRIRIKGFQNRVNS